jgi:hypothetical protein
LLEHRLPQAPQLAGSLANDTVIHIPADAGTAQDWQAPLQALVQQTPVTQNPDRQSPAAAQA